VSNVFEKRGVSAELAAKLVNSAAAKASELGVPGTIAVVDESGLLKAFRRLDGAPLGGVEIAPAKARMAASFGYPTQAFRDMAKEDHGFGAAVAGVLGNATILGGGLPIMVDGQLVGGLGVSAGMEDQDVEIAEAALNSALS
jgi:uncharacterized protein GlcG (DUF336 family)